MRLPSLRYLRTFQVAGRHLSFKDAADELSVTASAVSHQIKNLETWLGVPLFVRETRALKLTDAGEKYFEFLDSMFSRLESETQQLRNQYGRSVLRLCVPSFFASEALLPKMASFQQNSQTDLRVSTQSSAMKSHPAEADISILLGSSQWPQLVTHELFERRVVVACSKQTMQRDKVGSYQELEGRTLIAHDSRPDEWSHWAKKLKIRPPAAGNLLRFDTMSAVVKATEQGLGYALASWPLASEWFRSGALVRVFDEEVSTGDSFFLAYREDDAHRYEIQVLRDWLLSEFQEET